jgi:hypothetical protein
MAIITESPKSLCDLYMKLGQANLSEDMILRLHLKSEQEAEQILLQIFSTSIVDALTKKDLAVIIEAFPNSELSQVAQSRVDLNERNVQALYDLRRRRLQSTGVI